MAKFVEIPHHHVWAGTGANAKSYGIWSKDIDWDYGAKYGDLFLTHYLGGGDLRLMDIGCGNGHVTAPLYAHLQAQLAPGEVTFDLVDKQDVAIAAAKTAFQQVDNSPRHQFIQMDGTSAISDSERLYAPYKGIFAINLLHWFTQRDMYKFMRECHRLLDNDGIFIGSVCSVWNPANIGTDNQLKFNYVKNDVMRNGGMRNGMEFYQPRYEKIMTFSTPESLHRLCENTGYQICYMEEYENDTYKNGYGQPYQENIRFAAHKVQ